MDQSAADRPLDAKLVLDRVPSGVEGKPARSAGAQRAEGERSPLEALAGLLDRDRVGTCGVSFGGWTTLALNSIDRRPRASLPIVPAWGKGPVKTETLQALVRLDDWGRPVPTLVLAAERDALVLLAGLRELHQELRPPKRLAILKNSGHLHFCDNAEQGHEMLRAMWKSGAFPAAPADIDLAAIAEASRPFSELCSAADGLATVQGLSVAHMDAHVKELSDARAFLSGDLAGRFAARGIDLEVV
jgi:dienelactone hydrolase